MHLRCRHGAFLGEPVAFFARFHFCGGQLIPTLVLGWADLSNSDYWLKY